MSFKNVLPLLLFLSPLISNAQQNELGDLHIFEIAAPQLDTVKTIRVYLPKSYSDSGAEYPVLYMHDAQNLFDTATAFSGEWKVDEFLDGQKGKEVIVVGIDHGNKKRITELTPFPNEEYGGGGAANYVDFIRETLKPHIDVAYRTLRAPEHTAIMGSSLGGLTSFYATVKFPDTFGMAGVFSPSFWYNGEIYDFVEASDLKKSSRFYFLGGTVEGETMVPNLQKMHDLLLKKGLPKENLVIKIVEKGEHNEHFWGEEFPEAFDWLFNQNK